VHTESFCAAFGAGLREFPVASLSRRGHNVRELKDNSIQPGNGLDGLIIRDGTIWLMAQDKGLSHPCATVATGD
jgi:hypothetical protein